MNGGDLEWKGSHVSNERSKSNMSDNPLNSYVNHYHSLLLLGNLDVDFVYRRPSLSGEQEAWDFAEMGRKCKCM